ncbi:MAG: B12-binding domain-containing radical SAM protein [Bacteroidales bacterium]
MKVTFIQPAVGKKSGTSYAKTWCMEPLSIAVLSAITPSWVEKSFFDDRIEPVLYDEFTDLVAITTETYTAKRAYEIARQYRERNIPVVMGGFHATLATEEVKQYADAVVVGEAETSWPKLLDDFKNGTLQREYRNEAYPVTSGILPDRSIFSNKRYLKIGLVETSRGCLYHCEFCSIYGFFNKSYRNRPIDEIVADIKQSGRKFFFFVDDNLAMDRKRTLELCRALIPLKISWFGQVSIHISKDNELLGALRDSGCIGALIGFESFNEENIKQMGKNVNLQYADYTLAIKKMRAYGLIIYGTFVFGYESDTEKDFESVFRFARQNRLFMNAFNHLVPFPGTPLYERLKEENKLIHEKWWLMDNYKFGDVVFHPGALNAEQLANLCYRYRKKFFTWSSIFYRSLDINANCGSLKKAMVFFLSNITARKDVEFRQGLPVGKNG